MVTFIPGVSKWLAILLSKYILTILKYILNINCNSLGQISLIKILEIAK